MKEASIPKKTIWFELYSSVFLSMANRYPYNTFSDKGYLISKQILIFVFFLNKGTEIEIIRGATLPINVPFLERMTKKLWHFGI